MISFEIYNLYWITYIKININNDDTTFCREHKERWIRDKYELKSFIPPLPHPGEAVQRVVICMIPILFVRFQ